ncbi:DUF2971 domain-containing protein [Acidiphilium acidophilum]|uniref:DUF2971 domain-containing protein n=1 Tax=Acidiphilium acidophilum TaxID=76588 RepID=UPI002E8E628E|nr:DUF2971 domain-containing protein [Acidiphilium acidophilum]
MSTISDEIVLGNEILWKYFRPEYFISAIENNKIYFASANQFNDPFEGAVAVQTDTQAVDPRYPDMDPTENAFFELKRLTKISCWHRANYESDAMWRLYAEESKGIAICTTPDRMRSAFKPFRLKPEYGHEEIWAGPIKYIDLTQMRMKNVGMLNRFFFKHRAFEWEREFRLAISLRMAEENAVIVPEDGIYVDVDLTVLISRIVLGSTTSPELRAIISKHVEKVGLGNCLQISSLLGRPRYI